MEIKFIREITKEDIGEFIFASICATIVSLPMGLIMMVVIKTGLETFKPPYLQFVLDFFNFCDRPPSRLIGIFSFTLFFIITWLIGTLTFWVIAWLQHKDEQRWWNSLTPEEQQRIENYWTSIDYGGPFYGCSKK